MSIIVRESKECPSRHVGKGGRVPRLPFKAFRVLRGSQTFLVGSREHLQEEHVKNEGRGRASFCSLPAKLRLSVFFFLRIQNPCVCWFEVKEFCSIIYILIRPNLVYGVQF